MPELNGAHLSLFHGASKRATARYIAAVARAHNCAVITTTEGDARLARLARKALPNRYKVARRGEYLIIWDNSRLAGTSPARLLRLTRVRYFTGKGGLRLFRMARKNLRHRETGRRIRVETSHAPASVESGNRYKRNSNRSRVRASRTGFRTWGRKAAAFLRGRGKPVLILTTDSNLDQRRGAWRRYLTRVLGIPSIWSERVPGKGSHGSRLIDTAHVANAEVEAAWFTSVEATGDHDGIVYRIRF